MPEGDSLHRVARRLQALVGEQLEIEAPHPRAAALNVAQRLDGRRLDGVEAVGKNLVLRFEGGIVLRSHLRMRGRWQLLDRRTPLRGRPWLVLRGAERQAVLWNGPVLELADRSLGRLGPDVLASPLALDRIVANLRRSPEVAIGEALLDQRVVAGIGNVWRAEALWHARVSPWTPVGQLADDELRLVLGEAARLMRESLESGPEQRSVYRRRVCPRCRTRIGARGQGDANRTAYWCPHCQPGEAPAPARRLPSTSETATPRH